jgi:hypothetical protein
MTKTMSKAAVKIAETRAAEANKILATTRHLAADVEDAVAVEEVAVEEPKKVKRRSPQVENPNHAVTIR